MTIGLDYKPRSDKQSCSPSCTVGSPGNSVSFAHSPSRIGLLSIVTAATLRSLLCDKYRTRMRDAKCAMVLFMYMNTTAMFGICMHATQRMVATLGASGSVTLSSYSNLDTSTALGKLRLAFNTLFAANVHLRCVE